MQVKRYAILFINCYSLLHILRVCPGLPQIPQHRARLAGGASVLLGSSCSDGASGGSSGSSCSSCSGGGTEGYVHTRSSVPSRQNSRI